MRANRPHSVADAAYQLDLFDDALTEPEHARAELPIAKDTLRRSNASLEALPIEPAQPDSSAYGGSHAGADRAILVALETALADARAAADDRPALVVLASRLGELGTQPVRPPAGAFSLRQARDDWLRRLEASQKSESALVAYRVAIDDLLDWAEANSRSILEEATIVDYLRSYQQRSGPAQATYYRRFLLLRKFLRWVSQREGVRDPFLDLDPPPKPRQERDWLTSEEFRRLLDAAGRPERNLPGLAARDQLTLLALVTTARRRATAGDDPRRHHPTCLQAGRDREARDRAHAAPHRCDLAPAGARRHSPRRRVPRPRRPFDRGALRARRPRRALRGRRPTGAAGNPSVRTADAGSVADPGGSPEERLDGGGQIQPSSTEAKAPPVRFPMAPTGVGRRPRSRAISSPGEAL